MFVSKGHRGGRLDQGRHSAVHVSSAWSGGRSSIYLPGSRPSRQNIAGRSHRETGGPRLARTITLHHQGTRAAPGRISRAYPCLSREQLTVDRNSPKVHDRRAHVIVVAFDVSLSRLAATASVGHLCRGWSFQVQDVIQMLSKREHLTKLIGEGRGPRSTACLRFPRGAGVQASGGWGSTRRAQIVAVDGSPELFGVCSQQLLLLFL